MKRESDFIPWLLEQKYRDEPIGDLASDLAGDMEYNDDINATSHFEELKSHLYSMNACCDAISALKEAYKEWRYMRRTYRH